MNLGDKGGGAADLLPGIFPGLSSLKKPGWSEGKKGVHFTALTDVFGSVQLVCVIREVPLVPDVSKVIMAQHVKQPVVICGRKIIVRITNMIMQYFASFKLLDARVFIGHYFDFSSDLYTTCRSLRNFCRTDVGRLSEHSYCI